LLPNAAARLRDYQEPLEERFDVQPGHGLVFQALGKKGPLWSTQDGEAQ